MTIEKGYQSLRTWEEINELLEREVPKDLIKKKDSRKGIFGDYISGQAAIMLANQLFGSSGWEHRIDKGPYLLHKGSTTKGAHFLVYACTVEVIAYGLDTCKIAGSDIGTESAGSRSISHYGSGIGVATSNRDGDIVGQQIDTASKGAETDAVKRALKNYGRFLGLDLYFPDDHIWEHLVEDEPDADETPVKKEKPEPKKRPVGLTYPQIAPHAKEIDIKGKLKKPNDVVGDESPRAIKWFENELMSLPAFKDKGPYMNNHIGKHWNASSVAELTFLELAVTLNYAETGVKDPNWYMAAVKVSTDPIDVDAAVEIAAFMTEHKLPESLLDDVTKTHFGEALDAKASALILKMFKSVEETLGADNLVENGKMHPQLNMLLTAALNVE